ncbi:vitamin K epoxide reductase family protein [Neobacillus cucumis]|uniref:vitamin K epoxide reductase family protein n=1 Tax=Neobacillus cucumis TaxID=1740721 RepID=UPI0019665609|nr:vitamin K epoxide reductase family protein [Neobacillus cucumis]MBM7652791.1 putative membrane protein [Neobacillus cucumis]
MNSTYRKVGIAVSGIGWAVSFYIYFAHQLGKFVCPVGDCQTVNRSQYAQIGPVPVSVLGIVFYLMVLCLLLKVTFISEKIGQQILGILLAIGIIFSSYLTYAEIFWIHAICFWCMVSFVCVIVLTIIYWLDKIISSK